MPRKVFALNNTGTEVQTVLGYHEPKENVIYIDNAEINSFATTIDVSTAMDLDIPASSRDDDSVSARELLGGGGESGPDFNISPYSMESGSEYEHNEKILARIFRNIDEKVFDMAINMPSKFMKSVFVNKNFPELKGKKKEMAIKKEVNNKLDRPVNEANFDYINTVDNKILAFTYEGLPPFFNIYDKVKEQIKIRPKVKLILPEELILSNLVNYNYEPGPEDYVAIVHITTELSRIIITKGGKILHISQPINEHANSPGLLNKISGRLLFEKDISSINKFSRIVVTGEREEKDVVDYLRKQYSESELIEYFSVSETKFEINPEFINDDMSKLAPALGLLVSELLCKERNENFVDLVPSYIKDRQISFKLSWYNITLLILLAMTPVYLSTLYTKKKTEHNDWKTKTEDISNKLAEIQYVDVKMDSINSVLISIVDELNRVKGISKGANRLSETAKILSDEIEKIGGIWLTNMDYSRKEIIIEGYSKFRNRIPELVAKFENAEVKSITPDEIREAVVYRFQIVIHKLVKDETIFDPKITPANEG
ncbi:MAG: PilN domain-containing protein [Candidatus Marinimicrobia bacterium]|nr:PilN domain-containing protein [Candidatus Neomarinimicrobiota bacterium]